MIAPGQRAWVESYHLVASEEEHGRFQQGGRGASQRGLEDGREMSKYSSPQLNLLYHHHEEVHHVLEESLS